MIVGQQVNQLVGGSMFVTEVQVDDVFKLCDWTCREVRVKFQYTLMLVKDFLSCLFDSRSGAG